MFSIQPKDVNNPNNNAQIYFTMYVNTNYEVGFDFANIYPVMGHLIIKGMTDPSSISIRLTGAPGADMTAFANIRFGAQLDADTASMVISMGITTPNTGFSIGFGLTKFAATDPQFIKNLTIGPPVAAATDATVIVPTVYSTPATQVYPEPAPTNKQVK